MSRWKKLLLAVLVLLLVSQIPFAYRRFKLGRLHAAIQQVNSQRATEPSTDLVEFTGVVHVHSFLGGHSKGGFKDIIAAAQSNKLNFVIMTEHDLQEFNTSEMTLKGMHGGVLFVNGSETNIGNTGRLLVFPGNKLPAPASSQEESKPEIVAARPLAIVAYPEEFKAWDERKYNGIEVYNVYTNARQLNRLVMFFDGLWSYRSYPDLLFANFYARPSANLNTWDRAIAASGKQLVGVAGNDSHANIGFELIDSSGKKLLGLQLDPYERSFRLVRLHVLSSATAGDSSVTQERLLNAIAAGNCFIGYDIFGDTSGFRYTAQDGDESRIMGDQITLDGEVRLNVKLPVAGRIVLLKDGVTIQEATNVRTLEFGAKERGSYRVEAYLPQLGKPGGEQPWIISNPIYVR